MKFGKQFEFYKIPEWSEFYFDYSGIKTVLKFLDKRRIKKKQLKKIKTIKAKLRRLSTIRKDSDIQNDINTNNKEIEPNLNQNVENLEENNEQKPFLQPEKMNDHDLAKREKIMEAEDLSSYSNEEKLSKFLKIYKEKISMVNEFFLKKLEEFETKLENSKKKMLIKNQNLLRRNSIEIKRANLQLNAERDEMGYNEGMKKLSDYNGEDINLLKEKIKLFQEGNNKLRN